MRLLLSSPLMPQWRQKSPDGTIEKEPVLGILQQGDSHRESDGEPGCSVYTEWIPGIQA